MSSEIAIKGELTSSLSVSGVSKQFQIYDKPSDRLKQFVVPRMERLFGRSPSTFFREFWALNDVSFSLSKGETVGIIGRNGSGKSTLLQIIAGTLTPTTGNIERSGRIAALLELGAGFNPEFTGRENIFLNAAVLGLSQSDIEDRLADIIAFADIGDFVDQPVKTYSSGMQVRLAFAVIAHVDADVLIIDEALAVGDAYFVQKCMRFLRNFQREGTILFVSHDTNAVISLCDRAILLERGNMIMDGSPKDVTERYLADTYSSIAESKGIEGRKSDIGTVAVPVASVSKDANYASMIEKINASNLRNDLEVFEFDNHAPSFGVGGMQVEHVSLVSDNGQPPAYVVGGETVSLHVVGRVLAPMKNPIVGFFIKDRLGQTLFGDNTYLAYENRGIPMSIGDQFTATFKFIMPILPRGDYSVCAALADGTQLDHVQHHWVHDAVIIKSHASSASTGLVGIPMLDIALIKQ